MTPTEQQIANRVQWFNDLRSGKYRQGKFTMKRVVNSVATLCCLAVAAEGAGVTSKHVDDVIGGGPIFGFYFKLDADDNSYFFAKPPDSWFAERFGVTIIQADNMQIILAANNDWDGKSFAEIADIAEAMFEQYDAENVKGDDG